MKKSVLLSLFASLLTFSLLLCSCTGGSSDPGDTTAGSPASEAASSAQPDAGEELFLYEVGEFNGEKYCYISGVTDAGKKQKTLDIPEKNGEIVISGFNEGCFAGCAELETLTVHSNIIDWGGKLFTGCDKLTRINMDYAEFAAKVKADPSLSEDFTAAYAYDGSLYGENSVVEGMEKIRFYFTDADAYDFFDTNYFWGLYSDILIKE